MSPSAIPQCGGLCIGLAWIGARWQRTALNTKAQLLLERDFDVLAIRVGRHSHHRTRVERSWRGLRRAIDGLLTMWLALVPEEAAG